MARLIVHTAKRPYQYKTPKGDVIWICMCGLSDTYPICSGRHKSTTDEEDSKVYIYDENRQRVSEVNSIQGDGKQIDLKAVKKV
jgi:CDGSH-type Zn-finger protein